MGRNDQNGLVAVSKLLLALLSAAAAIVTAVVLFGIGAISDVTKHVSEMRGQLAAILRWQDRHDHRHDRQEDRRNGPIP